MVNPLYKAIIDRIRRVKLAPNLPRASVVPFGVGRIYKCIYTNYHHDPKPLLFILSSDFIYTTGINIHYLGANQRTMLRMIMYMRKSNQPLTGLIMYKFLKMRAPIIPKLGFRKYFTKYLRGTLVSDGVSQIPSKTVKHFFLDPFISTLNNMIKPKVVNKVPVSPYEAKKLSQDMQEAKIQADQRYVEKMEARRGT